MTKEEIEILREKQRKSGKEIGIKNLVPMNDYSQEQKREWAIKGAHATNEIRKRKKDIKTICNELLGINALDIAQDILDKDIVNKLNENGVNVTLYDLIVVKQIQKAIEEGNTKSAVFIRDSVGDKPTERVETDINVITESDKLLLNSIQDRLDSLEAVEGDYITINDVEGKKKTEDI